MLRTPFSRLSPVLIPRGSPKRILKGSRPGRRQSFYDDISSVQGKAFGLAEYDIFAGDPGFYKQDMANMKAVTIADVKRVYEQYIKGKNYIATSFVPKGKLDSCR